MSHHNKAPKGRIVRSLIEGLYNEDATGGLVPGVALSHTISEDLTTYTFLDLTAPMKENLAPV